MRRLLLATDDVQAGRHDVQLLATEYEVPLERQLVQAVGAVGVQRGQAQAAGYLCDGAAGVYECGIARIA
jgi:hypothetical protein